jgi:hypothetical protein
VRSALHSDCRRFNQFTLQFCIGFQNYLFSSSAAKLTRKLRSLSFRAILRQDSAFCPSFS